ncbi:hypothetical protein AB0D67_29035 [Streptosporangium sp. NPDC048047]|uniref:hypothetical protein n=1 Tax=Streptosporangium sp. NPDC048047 TaxID=3155748 RepID=UPI00342F7E0E
MLTREGDVWCDQIAGGLDPNCLIKGVQTSILTQVSETTVWLAQKITAAIEEHGKLDLRTGWFTDLYGTIRALATMVAVITLLVSVLFASLSRDGAELGRTLVRVLSAGVTTGLIVAIVMLAHQLIDEFCVLVLGEGGWDAITRRILAPVGYLWKVSVSASPDQPFVLMVLLSLALLFALAVIWVEMIIRRMLIDLCVMMWPLAAAGSVWSGARVWTARLRDTIVALLVVKPVIIVVLRMAAGQLEGADSPDDLLLAAGLFWLGAFSPFLVMRLIGLVQGALNPGGTSEGLRQVAAGATLAAAGKAFGMVSRLAGKGAGAAGAAMLGGGRTPMPQLAEPAQQETTPSDGQRDTSAERDSGAVKPIDAEVLRRMGHPVHTPQRAPSASSANNGSSSPSPDRHARPRPAAAQTSSPAAGSHTPPTVPGNNTPPTDPGNGTTPAPVDAGPSTPPAPTVPLPPPVQRTYTPVPPVLQQPLGRPPAPAGPGRATTPPPSPLPPRGVEGLRSYDDTPPVPPPSSAPVPDPPPPPPKEQP